MLKLYTDYSKFQPVQILNNSDGIFSKYTKKLEFSAKDKEYMLTYDGAEIIGDNERYEALIKTKYGSAYITNLSTGLKTLLNLAHFEEIGKSYKVIDITNFDEFSILVDDEKIVTTTSQLMDEILRGNDKYEE